MDTLRDADVEAARASGGEIPLAGGRELLLPRVFGFCAGVVRALAILADCLARRGERTVRLLGPVIHNETVNDWLRSQGVVILDEDRIEDILLTGQPGDIVVIPAFGVPLALEQALRRRYPPERIVDTTCRDVRAVWHFLERLEGTGWTVIIHGQRDHPETRAILSRALPRAARVAIVHGTRGAERVCAALRTGSWDGFPPGQLIESPGAGRVGGPVALVTQTTMLAGETMALASAVQAACREAGCPCRVAEGVCPATQARQDAALEVCRRRPDIILVIGGFQSSNTTQLHRLASEYAPAYRVRNAGALSPERIEHWVPESGLQVTGPWLPAGWRRVGVLAGASCPPQDIGEVIRWFRRLSTQEAG